MKKTPAFIPPADRISSFEPYFFASLGKKINELRKQGMDVIRIDMGSPDLPPEEGIIDALIQSALKPTSHGYTPNGGSLAFRQAIATYYLNRFNVELDPARIEIGHHCQDLLVHLGHSNCHWLTTCS